MKKSLMLLLFLASCAGAGDRPNTTMAFDQAKQIVLASRGRIWKDPDSIRDARIGQTYGCIGHLLTPGMVSDACICVEANARNSFGGYTGLQQSVAIISGGVVVDTIPARAFTDRCDAMTPFPELNGGPPPAGPKPVARR